MWEIKIEKRERPNLLAELVLSEDCTHRQDMMIVGRQKEKERRNCASSDLTFHVFIPTVPNMHCPWIINNSVRILLSSLFGLPSISTPKSLSDSWRDSGLYRIIRAIAYIDREKTAGCIRLAYSIDLWRLTTYMFIHTGLDYQRGNKKISSGSSAFSLSCAASLLHPCVWIDCLLSSIEPGRPVDARDGYYDLYRNIRLVHWDVMNAGMMLYRNEGIKR